MQRTLLASLICVSVGLAGCAEQLARVAQPSEGILPPVAAPITEMNRTVRALPPPENRVAIAVYGFSDQTGQFKPVDNVQSLSKAVTQGATSVLIKALQDAGDGRWFTVVERERLDNLLKERRIIADMRERYLGEKNINPQALPPLLFAGVLLEGGIIGFDSNTKTGGAGARYLGIGGDVQYREDIITIYLRAISTKTGEVLVSVVSHKTIVSIGVRGSAFKFVAIDKILEAEAGFTHNEPHQIATQAAVEKAVHSVIVEGAARGIWSFADKRFQSDAVSKYDQEQRQLNRTAQATPPKGPPTAVAANANGGAAAQTANAPPQQQPQGQAQANAPKPPAAPNHGATQRAQAAPAPAQSQAPVRQSSTPAPAWSTTTSGPPRVASVAPPANSGPALPPVPTTLKIEPFQTRTELQSIAGEGNGTR